jgi:hypothetical protein
MSRAEMLDAIAELDGKIAASYLSGRIDTDPVNHAFLLNAYDRLAAKLASLS